MNIENTSYFDYNYLFSDEIPRIKIQKIHDENKCKDKIEKILHNYVNFLNVGEDSEFIPRVIYNANNYYLDLPCKSCQVNEFFCQPRIIDLVNIFEKNALKNIDLIKLLKKYQILQYLRTNKYLDTYKAIIYGLENLQTILKKKQKKNKPNRNIFNRNMFKSNAFKINELFYDTINHYNDDEIIEFNRNLSYKNRLPILTLDLNVIHEILNIVKICYICKRNILSTSISRYNSIIFDNCKFCGVTINKYKYCSSCNKEIFICSQCTEQVLENCEIKDQSFDCYEKFHKKYNIYSKPCNRCSNSGPYKIRKYKNNHKAYVFGVLV